MNLNEQKKDEIEKITLPALSSFVLVSPIISETISEVNLSILSLKCYKSPYTIRSQFYFIRSLFHELFIYSVFWIRGTLQKYEK